MANLTLRGFAAALTRAAAAMPSREAVALRASGRRLTAAARGYIGYYQPAVSPFPAWRPLAHATLYGGVTEDGRRFPGKIELGYAPPDNPLLRDGNLRDSIGYRVERRSVSIGSASDVALWQELGTVKIPPRSFLGRAVAEHGRREAHAIAAYVFEPLLTLR